MFILRRGCFAKYTLVTFFLLFVYSFVVTNWIPSGNVVTKEFLAMNPDANHKIEALDQINDKVESALIDVIENTGAARPTTSRKLSKDSVSKVNTVKPTNLPRTTTPRTSPTNTKRTNVLTSTQRVRHLNVTKPPAANSGNKSKTSLINATATTSFPLGEDNTWNFTVANNPHPFKFLKNASDVCASRRVFVLNIIHSKPSNSLHRNIIRKTWGNTTANRKLDTATVFVLGRTTDRKIEDAVDAEDHKYHDIVQEDFLDSYRNLTYKSVAVLKWITKFCPKAEFILKTDDDVFVNPFDINRLIRRQLLKEPNATKIMCQLSNRSVLRQKRFKWYVPEIEYPYKRYPPYCMGTAFIMPQSVVPQLYNASFTTKFFWIDDVYSTGMLAHIANVSHVNIIKKFVYKANEFRDKLLFGEAAIAHVGGGPNVQKKEQYWEEILKIERNET